MPKAKVEAVQVKYDCYIMYIEGGVCVTEGEALCCERAVLLHAFAAHGYLISVNDNVCVALQNPTHNQRLTYERMLRRLFTSLEDVEALLTPILSDAAAAHRAHYPRPFSPDKPSDKDKGKDKDKDTRKVVKVMILNHGNLGVFLNFMCSVHKAVRLTRGDTM
jgi:hypothetical protein